MGVGGAYSGHSADVVRVAMPLADPAQGFAQVKDQVTIVVHNLRCQIPDLAFRRQSLDLMSELGEYLLDLFTDQRGDLSAGGFILLAG